MMPHIKNQANEMPLIGVGLRTPHYEEALTKRANIDFVEVHAENFFALGGVSHAVLGEISKVYALSLHATSLGLGSAIKAPSSQLEKLTSLVEQYQPILVSDHACFTWSEHSNTSVHAGDLLPIPFTDESLKITAKNVERVQEKLNRQILIENISAYVDIPGSTYHEADFLVTLCRRTGCRLLIDLNNLIVNALNKSRNDKSTSRLDWISRQIKALEVAKRWLNHIPPALVGEIHLAGCAPAKANQLTIDDHSQPVSDVVWQLYRHALSKFGPVPTLIEWDENLPTWQVLIAEVDKARTVAQQISSQTQVIQPTQTEGMLE